MGDKPLTAEQQEEYSAGQAVSYRFLRRHLDVQQNSANARTIADWILSHNLPWTDESLEQAYQAVKDSLQHGETKVVAASKKEEPKWSHLTKADIAKMSAAEMKKNNQDPAFVEAVNRLGIQSNIRFISSRNAALPAPRSKSR